MLLDILVLASLNIHVSLIRLAATRSGDMSSKQSKEMASPVKKKFVSPINHSKRNAKSGISPKFRANLKAEFGKSLHQLSKGEQGLGHGKHPFPQHQRRKTQEKRRTSQIRYHMGGTIADPLNLNSLINRDPACVTPQASPMHHGESPVPIVEPQDSTDPLNLKCIPTSGKEVLVTPSKKKKKKKHRMSHTDEENIIETSGEKEDQNSPKEKKNKRKRKRSRSRSGGEKMEEESNKPSIDTDTNEPCVKECTELQNDSSIEKSISSDKESESELAAKKAKEENVKTEQTMIVSSVPQDSSVSCDKQNTKTVRGSSSHPNHRRKEKLFIYGNYTRYYGKRNPNHMEDSRLKCFKKEWFADKDVLDIGCNVGHVTLSIARDFKPRYIIGNDIDSSLIRAARNNIRFYIQTPVSGWTREGIEFPISFALVSGPLAAPVVAEEEAKPVFPHNVIFKQVGSYRTGL